MLKAWEVEVVCLFWWFFKFPPHSTLDSNENAPIWKKNCISSKYITLSHYIMGKRAQFFCTSFQNNPLCVLCTAMHHESMMRYRSKGRGNALCFVHHTGPPFFWTSLVQTSIVLPYFQDKLPHTNNCLKNEILKWGT